MDNVRRYSGLAERREREESEDKFITPYKSSKQQVGKVQVFNNKPAQLMVP